jgi:CheY-like chemotaxis protein
MKILLADDDIVTRIVLESILKKACYDVTLCANGEEAIEELKQSPFDLLVTDLIMPKKDGIAVMEFIKQYNLGIPILAISAGDNDDPEDYLAYAGRFADQTMPKPIKKDALLRAVEILTNKKQKRSLFK